LPADALLGTQLELPVGRDADVTLQERLRRALTGRYAISSEIGRGGMAMVYLAEDCRHGRSVAVKVLHPDLGAAVGPERFLREVRTVAGLRHPHVLPLLDSGEADGLLYYVMPYVEGGSLRQRLSSEGRLSRPREGHHPPGHQAGEHPPRSRLRAAHRFRYLAHHRPPGR
jgi:serine/threonine protein kinase